MRELESSEKDLFIKVGAALLADSMAGRPPLEHDLELTGRNWFAQHLNEFRHAICGNHHVKIYLEGKSNADRAQLVAAIVDLIATVTGNVPAATVAVLLLNQGLEKLCSGGASA
jgi:hypothetical protein